MQKIGDRLEADRCSPAGGAAPTAAYVHIPFCRRRCYYCDFPVSIVGDRPPLARQTSSNSSFGAIAQYLDPLCQEIVHTPGDRPLHSVFLGGGTPSLLEPDQVQQILTTLEQRFGMVDGAEISMEIDPDTVDADKVKGYHAAGINRVSLGVQAFQLDLLQACGRTHTPADIDRAMDSLRQAGFTNISLDLISGLPHQTPETWEESLQRAIALAPTHLSIYDLIVEPQTAFSRWYQPGELPLPSDQVAADLYRLAQQRLTAAGFEHYEISNYARPGYACQHNGVYWRNQPYYGFGMGAASYMQQQRYTRPRTRAAYFEWVNKLQHQGWQLDVPVDPAQDTFLETVMLGLRLADGLEFNAMADIFGLAWVQHLWQFLNTYTDRGWIEWAPVLESEHHNPQHDEHPRSSRVRLTDPEGFLFSNVVLSDVFQAFSDEPREPCRETVKSAV
ncbi:MAG: coproporphyrinogen III oxidase [Leptolyngbya sp. DLM2.Bin15]|nr:MAG: coproporphyrinogen III oxidase [Leptolyngbya sp. DLM2.Bin15]